MTVQMHAVQSSMLTEAGYNQSTQELFVRFKGGKLYRYLAVPQAYYDAMLSSESCGKYLNSNIKPNFAAELVAE